MNWGALELEELCGMGAPEWLVQDWLPEHGTAILYGKSSTGKSFAVVSMADAVLTGCDWYGHAVKRGAVVYVATEGQPGLGKRFRALRQRRIAPEAPFLCLSQPVNLLSSSNVEEFIRYVTDWNSQIRLIICDTLHGCMPGVQEENSNAEMGRAIDAAKRIAKETGALVLLVHHTGRNGLNPRGGYVLECDTDARIRIGTPNSPDLTPGGTVTLYNQKERDDGRAEPITFRAELVTLPKLPSEPVAPTTLVLVPGTAEQEVKTRRAGPKGATGNLVRILGQATGPIPGPLLAKRLKCQEDALRARVRRAREAGYDVQRVSGGYVLAA